MLWSKPPKVIKSTKYAETLRTRIGMEHDATSVSDIPPFLVTTFPNTTVVIKPRFWTDLHDHELMICMGNKLSQEAVRDQMIVKFGYGGMAVENYIDFISGRMSFLHNGSKPAPVIELARQDTDRLIV
ncbi:MAG: hypothetical protein M1814_003719 [Vezdaea aestivalis]|nr:MAG: hypothetical protein M1814_003719 [Vezdaea aestivalis]